MGFDAHSEVIQAIKDGEVDATIAQKPERIGRMGVEYANKLLSGESVPEAFSVEIELITEEDIVMK